MKKAIKRCSLAMCIAVAVQFSIVVNAANWSEGTSYRRGEIVTYNGVQYGCLVDHTAWVGTNWNPADTPSLWTVVGEDSIPEEEIPSQEDEITTGEEITEEEPAEEITEEEPTEEITEEETTEVEIGLVPEWEEGKTYKVGDLVKYNDVVYECITEHTAWVGTNWNPEMTPTLWNSLEDIDVTIPETPISNPTPEMPINNPTPETPAQEPNQNDNTNDIQIVESKGEWADTVFAPYVDVMLWPTPSINDFMRITGNKYYTLAFILSNGGNPAWGGVTAYNDGFYKDEISQIRQNGGDVIVSFGGANGTELALDIKDVSKLQQAYQKVIDEYQLTWIDFDIEGFAVMDKQSIQRRNEAIVGLQKANPDLTIAYCLPVMPEGLTAEGLFVLKDAKEKGINIDVVNIMTMDYGGSYSGDMGKYAIQAAQNTEKQIRDIGLNSKIGNTPMIGTNDVSSEIFTQEDAQELLEWAKSNDNVRLLSMWSITRDKATGTGLYNYTMIPQNDYDFTNILKGFNK